MKPILMLGAAVLALAGCSADGGYVGPQTAPFFEADTLWFSGRGMPTAVPEGSTAAGYREEDGKISDIYSWIKTDRYEALGRPSWMLPLSELSIDAQRIIALLYLCSEVPNSEPCNAAARPDQPPNLDDLSFEHLIPN